MDELTLSLTGGTNGYKVQLRELFVKGASNYTVEDIKLGSPFEAIVRMPALILDAHYSRFTISQWQWNVPRAVRRCQSSGQRHRFDETKGWKNVP